MERHDKNYSLTAHGAWGHKPFENDAALDWSMGPPSGDGDTAIDTSLRTAMNAAYLDADEGSAAVAAAAIVAAASDGDVQDLPEDVTALARDWKPEAAIVQLAIEALVAVAGSQSELASLWAEGDEGKSWRATLERLQERLHSR